MPKREVVPLSTRIISSTRELKIQASEYSLRPCYVFEMILGTYIYMGFFPWFEGHPSSIGLLKHFLITFDLGARPFLHNFDSIT